MDNIIKVNFDNLQDAIDNLNLIENQLDKREDFIDFGLNESSGESYDAFVQGINELNGIKKEMQSLIIITKELMKNAGVAFDETDKAIAKALTIA